MPGVTVTVVLQDIKKLDTDALVVGFYENVRPLKGLAGELDWLLCGSLSRLIITNKLSGSLGDVALLTSRGKVPAKKIFMIGLGPREDFSQASLRIAARAAVTISMAAGVSSTAVEYFQPSALTHEDTVRAMHTGLYEGVGKHTMNIALLAPDAGAYEKISHLIHKGTQQRRGTPADSV
jgi:hypothetical protein